MRLAGAGGCAGWLRLHPEGMDVTGSPFFIAVMSVFSRGDYEADSGRYLLVCVVALGISVVVLCRMSGYSWPAALVSVAAVGWLLAAVQADIARVGNVTVLQVLMLTVALLLVGRRDRAALVAAGGACLGAAVMFKPTVALAAGMLIGWLVPAIIEGLCGAGSGRRAGAGAAMAAGCLYIGDWHAWSNFLVGMRQFSEAPQDGGAWQRFAAQAHCEYGGAELSWVLLVGLVGAAVACIAIGRAKDRRRAAGERAGRRVRWGKRCGKTMSSWLELAWR